MLNDYLLLLLLMLLLSLFGVIHLHVLEFDLSIQSLILQLLPFCLFLRPAMICASNTISFLLSHVF